MSLPVALALLEIHPYRLHHNMLPEVAQDPFKIGFTPRSDLKFYESHLRIQRFDNCQAIVRLQNEPNKGDFASINAKMLSGGLREMAVSWHR